ncbi:hypothetical protein ACH4E8_03705 [Streptomyces sp. NPDC017979]|uniref:hypothetical protein n=1 Tax=unclassified Streptomyces TaxID=2593676 RepID=UPI0037B81EB2
MTSQTPSTPRRFALGAGLTVAAVAAALGAGQTAAQAAPVAVPVGELGGLDVLGSALSGPGAGVTTALTNSVSGLGYLKEHQINPLAQTGVDPLANGVGTQVADFKPVGTDLVTGPLSDGGALKDLPVVGGLVQTLPL